MSRIQVKDALEGNISDNLVILKGWVKTKRGSKNVSFISLTESIAELYENKQFLIFKAVFSFLIAPPFNLKLKNYKSAI